MRRSTVIALALLLVSPILMVDVGLFFTARILDSETARPRNIFYRMSDAINFRILRPWFSLFGLIEDDQSCS